MEFSVEELSPTRVRFTIEVPFEELAPSFAATYEALLEEVEVTDLGPEESPAPYLDEYFGRRTVLESVVEHAVIVMYQRAVEESRTRVWGQPDFELVRFVDGVDMAFTAEVDLRPLFELPDYRGLEVVVDLLGVTAEEVDEAVAAEIRRFTFLRDADKPVEPGDYVALVDVTSKRVPEGDERRHYYSGYNEVGSGVFLPGLDEALVGMRAGESKTVMSNVEGVDVEITFTVHSVRVMVRPTASDQFAQETGAFDSLAEMRESLRKDVLLNKRVRVFDELPDKAVGALAAKIDIAVPVHAVEVEIADRYRGIEQENQSPLWSLEDYAAERGFTLEELRTAMREDSWAYVKARLVLDELADREGLVVTDEELDAGIAQEAALKRITEELYRQQLAESSEFGDVLARVRRGKAIDLLLENVKPIDVSGAEVDLPAIRRELLELAELRRQNEAPFDYSQYGVTDTEG